MKNIVKNIQIKSIIFLCLAISFVITLIIAAFIPTTMVKNNVISSLEFIDYNESREWHNSFTYETGSILDDYMDSEMVSYAVSDRSDYNALENAVNANEYTRYWHGYMIILKPLLVFFTYSQIRYLFMYLYLVLFAWVCVEIHKRIGIKGIMAYSISLATIYFPVLSYSIQFSAVFFITLIATIFICKKYRAKMKLLYITNWFMVIGMITNFFDLLTAPLVTLGMPLAIILLINMMDTEDIPIKKNLIILIRVSFCWCVGYGGSWIAKWIIASIVLKKNIILDAILQARFRINGDENIPLNRVQMYKDNIETIIPTWFWSSNRRIFLAVIALFIMVVVFILNKRTWKEIRKLSPFLILATYPFIWYFVMSNHSQIHFFFTYRIQMITVFSLLSIFLFSLKNRKEIY